MYAITYSGYKILFTTIRDVKKQYRRNHNLWDTDDKNIPVYGTIASQFNDPGMNTLYKHLMDLVNEFSSNDFSSSFTLLFSLIISLFLPAR